MTINPIDKNNYNEKNNPEITPSEHCLAIPEILEKIFMYSSLSGMGNLSLVNRSINQTAKALQNKENYPKTYQKILLRIFADLFKKPVGEIASCFISLSEKNKISELEFLIHSQKFNEIGRDPFYNILLQVTDKGYEQVAKTLMTSLKFNEIDLDSLGKFLQESAEKGYMQIVKKIMNSSRFEEINGRYLGAALYQATLHKHEELAIELLNVCHPKESIPADPAHSLANDWGEAFKYAAQNGLDEFINRFITVGTPFDKIISNQLADSLILASRKGHLKVVEAIIASSRFHEITQDNLNKAYQRALSAGHEAACANPKRIYKLAC